MPLGEKMEKPEEEPGIVSGEDDGYGGRTDISCLSAVVRHQGTHHLGERVLFLVFVLGGVHLFLGLW